jgi:cobalt-zinc-cadmium efflux system outer membrane protein
MEQAADAGVKSEPAAVTPGEEVSLEELLTYADEHSPALAVARSTRSRAEAARIGAAILLPDNPEVSLGVGPRLGLGGQGIDVQASVMQPIQIAGERGLRLNAAEKLSELTDAEIERERWSVHSDVHAMFHRAGVERERLRLTERVVAFQEEVLRAVERQIAAGETAALTLRLARAEAAQARQTRVAAQQAFLASRIALAQLSGWAAATPPLPSGKIDAPREPPPLEELIKLASERLPSLRAAASRVREAEARAELADREGWPRPSIGLQYNREGNPTSEGVYDSILGVVSVQLPTFQRNQAERARAHADVSVAAAELAALQKLLEGQVAQARNEMVAAAKRTEAYGTEILPQFEENLTLLRRSFELGEIDLLALSTGRERFLRIQSDALAAQVDYFTALAGLERVVGVELWRDDHHEENP